MLDKFFHNIQSSNFDYIFEHSDSMFLLIFDEQQKIVSHSHSLLKHTHQQGSFIGKKLDSIFHETEIGKLLSSEEKTIQILSMKPDAITWKCYLLKNRENIILTGERLKMNDNTTMNQLVNLTNEIANLGRELQRKNRELKRANEKITSLSRIDPLTQLYNRRYFQEIFAQNISMAERHGTPVCIILCDIDHFKSVNDTYGHDAGDLVLTEFSELIRESCRKEDIPVRFGGEEFVILLQNSDGKAGQMAAEKLRKMLEEKTILADRTITASFGVAEFFPGNTAAVVIKHADASLYKSKESGRNRVTLYSPLAKDTG
jgi:diguanylate cyclase (GGDEF)-like protein